MLEIFEAGQHAHPTTRVYSFIIQTKASDIRLGSMQRQKARRLGCAEAMASGTSL